ncbi:MAG: deoxyribodipyrimidine photo-lyase [Calditrichaeota bacterium]|nr:deoxyribodipyrimidine photo-lyase [Calditrichota bacterium]
MLKKVLRIFVVSIIIIFTLAGLAFAQKILVYMDLKQNDHLKAYGVAYWALEKSLKVEWLLNYRGGSFFIDFNPDVERELRIRGVSYSVISGSAAARIYAEIEQNNMDVVLLEKAPAVAVYQSPRETKWDDAVALALDYAEIPYAKLWDKEVLTGELDKYDWLHLHHEDFTGQYGKFYRNYRNTPWYVETVKLNEAMAREMGFKKVSQLKLAVVKMIKEYVLRGGFLFAMCSGTDTYDIALAAANTDICAAVFDGDPVDPNFQQKLDYSKCLAFQNFKVITDPLVYEYSDIDIPPSNNPILRDESTDYFTLFEFSAKYDPVPTMLTQCHVSVIKGFMGQTTGFRKSLIKRSVVIMAETEGTEQVKYLHGNLGKGTFTFYGGHDPEDYRHFVGDPKTQLSLHKNSPGYRLILNNILFPAAKKKKRKT